MKSEILILAAEKGFFRSKKQEKRDEIIAEIEAEYPDARAILEKETEKRAAEYRRKIAAKVAREAAQEAKPIRAGVSKVETPSIEGTRFLVTCGQNNTDANKAFFETLKRYAEYNKAQLIICPTLYNKNAYRQPDEIDSEGVHFDPVIMPYMVDHSVMLGGKVFLAAGSNVSPTCRNPLSGYENISMADNVIIPACQIALKVLPALKPNKSRRMFSTGAVTLRNMLNRKAGDTALHQSGALIVEIEGDKVNIRQLELVSGAGGFYDQGTYYSLNGDINSGHSPAAIQLGDIHAEHLDKQTRNKVLDFLYEYKPQKVICHDVSDFRSRNHHNRGQGSFRFATDLKQSSIVQDINQVTSILDAIADYCGNIEIIESNHDLALQAFLESTMANKEPFDSINAEFTYSALTAMLQTTRWGNHWNALKWACNASDVYDSFSNRLEGLKYPEKVNFNLASNSVQIEGIEQTHGHVGASGARGNPTGYSRLGHPVSTGHTHSPSIIGLCYTAGVCSTTLSMGYNDVGASSWAMAHVVTWPACESQSHGQRQVIFQD